MMKTSFTYKDLYIFFLNLYFICLPLGAMNLGSFGSALKIVAVFPILIAFLLGKKIRFTPPLTLQFLFTGLALFSVLWSISFDVSLGRGASYVLLLLLLISGTAFTYTTEETKKIKMALVWSSRITAVIMLLFGEYSHGRFSITDIITENPNYICAYFAFGVIYTISVLTEKNTVLKKLFASAELIVYFYLVLITGSRGGLLSVIACAVMYLATFKESKKKVLRRVITLAFLLLALSILIENLPETLRLRFTVDDVVETGGTGRTNLWQQTWDLFCQANPFRQAVGQGTGTIINAFEEFGYRVKNVTHNIFLETLAELGVIGFALYTAAIFSFLRSAFSQKDKFAFSAMFCMLVLSLSSSIYTFKPYFNIMLFILILENLQIEQQGQALRGSYRDEI